MLTCLPACLPINTVKRHLIERLTANNTFYYLMNIDKRIKDVEQVVVRDSNGFMGYFHVFPGDTIRPVLKVVFFTQRIGAVAGWSWSVVLILYYFISVKALKLAM
eukprot:SAG22_NODE_5861_length_940_cov_1.607610_2_plen_104_part_01